MKLIANQSAPVFQTTDLYGSPVSLAQLAGKRILLTFFRTAGCPVCNLRFHALEPQWNYFKANNLVFIAVYARQPDNMRHYIESSYPGRTPIYPIFIADPDQSLYKLYGTERSTSKLVNSLLFHGGFSNVSQGKKLFKDKINDDGPTNLINADFLIDETGRIITAYYGKYSGDFIPIETIKAFVAAN